MPTAVLWFFAGVVIGAAAIQVVALILVVLLRHSRKAEGRWTIDDDIRGAWVADLPEGDE